MGDFLHFFWKKKDKEVQGKPSEKPEPSANKPGRHLQQERQTDMVLRKLVKASEEFLQMAAHRIDFQKITDVFLEISGARFVALNIYKKKGDEFSTVAVSGLSKHIRLAIELLGYDIIGKSWPHDPVRAAKIRDNVLTRFGNLSELAGHMVPLGVIHKLESLIDIGEVIVLKIMKGNRLIGDFTFVMPKNNPYLDDHLVSIYARQTGLLLSRKEAEEELLEAKEHEEKANKAKSEFLAGMGHELRTPLNAILGFSEILSNEDMPPEQLDMIRSIASSGKLLLDMINDILDLSRLEAGKIALAPKPVSVYALLNDMELMFMERASKKGLSLTFDTPEKTHEFILVDETRLKQILFNLISNAIKYTTEGKVQVIVEFKPKSAEKGDVSFTVKDTGQGIHPNEQARIFEGFSFSSNKKEKGPDNIGLGLAISKKLTQMMGGKISVKSKPGKGAAFTLVLPDIKTLGKTTTSTTPDDSWRAIRFAPGKALVVDDVPSNLEVMKIMLQNIGLEAITVDGGKEAIDLLKEQLPDIILLDTQMPGMSGSEVIKVIRETPEWAAIPVLAYTAGKPDSQQYDGYVLKPVSKKNLVAALKPFFTPEKKASDKSHTDEAKQTAIKLSPDDLVTMAQCVQELQNTFLPRWNEIKDQLVLFKIESFANDLKSLSLQYKCRALSIYADKLLNQVNDLDLEAIEVTLRGFPGKVDQIKKLLEK